MTTIFLQIMQSQSLISQTIKETLEVELKDEKDIKKIFDIILQSFGDDELSKKQFVQKMWTSNTLKKGFYPIIYYRILRNKLSNIFGADINNSEQMECLQRSVVQNQKNYQNMVKSIYLQFLGEQISNGQLKQIMDDLQHIKKERQGIEEILQQERNQFLKHQKKSDEEAFLESQIKDCQQYCKNLEEDLIQMPKNTVQYEFTIVEIQLCKHYIKTKTQEFSNDLELTTKLIKKLQTMEIIENQAKKAIAQILRQEDIRRNLKVLKQKICGINIKEIFRMIKKGRQLQKDQSKIKKRGKKIRVIMFIGLSKAGKTTIMTRLMGYEMKKIKMNGMITIQPKDPESMSEEHRQLIIGYENKSTTRYPKLYEIKVEEEDDQFITFGMDCAGFEDAAGTQVEISNKITTIQALKKVDELQIAIVINQKNWGTRGQDIEILASTVSSIIKDYKKAKPAISFVFNQFSQDFKETFYSNVSNLYKNILQLSKNVLDQNFKSFFTHLKQSSKSSKKMFCVNPLTLKPEEFLQEVSVKKNKIQNPVGCLISDIGMRPKQEIKKYCQRCKKQFNRSYQSGDMEGAQYYLNMLELIASQPKLESSADRQIQSMKVAIEKGLVNKISQIKIEFEQLETVFIRDLTHRQNKFENLKQKFSSLKKQTQRFETFNKKSELNTNLDNILYETGRWYTVQMQKWRNEDGFNISDLSNTTVSAIEFSQKFAFSQKQLKNKLNQFLLQFKRSIQNQFQNLQPKNQIKKNYDKYSSLANILGYENILLQNQIPKKFQELAKNMTLINMEKIYNKQANGEEIRLSINEEQDIKSVNNLLRFCEVVLTYPKQIIYKIEQKLREAQKIIIIDTPLQVMKQFDEFLSFSKKDETEEKQLQIQGQNQEPKPHNNIDQTIKNIHKLIKWLKILDKVESIKNYHENKLLQKFQGLQHIIQKQMRNIQKIKQAFSQNDVNVLKKDIKKVRSQVKKLQNLVKVADNRILAERFQNLKQELDQSFSAFVAANESSDNFTVNSSQKQLKNVFIRYEKLFQFKQIYRVIGLESKQSNLKQRIQKILKLNQIKVLDPIQKYEKQIQNKNSLQFAKLSSYLKYLEFVRQNDGSKLYYAISQKLNEAQSKIKQRIMGIYSASILVPLKKLTTILTNQVSLEDENLANIQNSLKSGANEQARKALFFLSEIHDKPKLIQLFFNDIQDIQSQIYNDLEDFRNKIEDKIGASKVNFKSLEKLQTITFKLKNIQSDKNMFDALHSEIRGKIKEHSNRQESIIQTFKNTCNDMNSFDEQTFKELYFKYLNSTNETECKNKQALQYVFGNYKRSVKQYLQKLQIQLIDDQTLEQKIIQILKVIQKYCKNIHNIKQKIGENKQFNDKSELRQLQHLMVQIIKRLIYFCQKFQQNLYKTQSNEIKKTVQKLKQIDALILYVQKCKNNIVLEDLERFKKEQQINYINEFINKKFEDRNKKISDMKKGEMMFNDQDFMPFYRSLTDKQKIQILKSLRQQLEKRLIKIQALYKQNYRSYERQYNNLQRQIDFMPQEICKEYFQKLRKLKQKIQKQQKNLCEDFLNNVEFSLGIILSKAQNYKKTDNKKAILDIVEALKQKSRQQDLIYSSKYLQILQNEFWKRKTELQQVTQILEEAKKIQNKLCTKLTKDVQRSFKKIKDGYSQQKIEDSSNDDSYSDIFTSSTTGNTKKNVENIIFIYDCLKNVVNNKGLLSQSSFSLCSAQLNIIQEQIQKFLVLVEENLNQFGQIIKNPKNSKRIGPVFQAIVMIQRDLQFFGSSKSEHFKIKFGQANFKLHLKRVYNSKQQLTTIVNNLSSTRFIFYDDEIRTMSNQKLEQNIVKYEQNLQILHILQKGYNSYFSPKKRIDMQEIMINLKIQINKAIQQFQKSLNQCFQNRKSDDIDQRVNVIQKLFNVVKSKQRSYLVEFEQYSDKFKELRRGALKPELTCFQSKIKHLIQINKSMDKKIQQFKETQYNKIKKSKQILEKEQLQMKNIQNKYDGLIQNQKDEKAKQKLLKQKQGEIKNIINTNLKAQQIARDKVQQTLNKFIKSQQKQYDEVIEQVCKQLLFLKKLSMINEIADQINKFLNEQLKKLEKWAELLNKIYKYLNEEDNYYAGVIIDECPSFKKFKAKQFIQNTSKTNSAGYILGQMLRQRSINIQQKDILERYFQIFNEEQNKHISYYEQTKDRQIIHSLVVKIITEADDIKKILENKQSGEVIGDTKRVQLLARIFALWSISSSFSDESGNLGIGEVCYKAHAAQVICILIILSMDNSNDRQVIRFNRLAEVKTGEGKSIVLAALSIYFSLFGYEVHCACYSPMLSKRDQKEFEPLFQQCGVKYQISYGVFEQIIKKVLNQTDRESNNNQTFENVIKEALTTNIQEGGLMGWIKRKVPFMNKIMNFFGNIGSLGCKMKKILIIDEIDVLFDKNYFGDTFNQSIQLRDQTIIKLFRFIWNNKEKITVEKVQKSEQFLNLVNRFPVLKNVLQNQINGMILALKTYHDQNYTIQDKKIMYKVEDTLMDISYRYNTVYAYLQEFDRNKVSQAAFNEHMTINLCVAEFSYACLPEYYDYVVGVTGTLTCLPAYIKNYLQTKYKIDRTQMFPIPSVYGSSTENRVIQEPVCVEKSIFKQQVVKRIKKELDKNRPVLVFFRTKTVLHDLFASQQFKQYQKYTTCITQQHDEKQRNIRIRNCSFKSTITFMTNAFIRGTDFKLQNKNAISLGGFHAIVTYLIGSQADWIQATGRIARQGKPGSIGQIYPDDQFQILSIDKEDPNRFRKVPEARRLNPEKQKDSCEERLTISQLRHNQTISVFNPQKFSQNNLVEYVYSKNKFPEVESGKKARICLVMDKTVSMEACDMKLRACLPQIFDDIDETLTKNKGKGCLEMQIVFYRNYNSPLNELLQYSTFQVQSLQLKNFVSRSSVSGGWGNEAVEVALQHINRLSEVQQVIIFGDAPGNTKQQVKYKRNSNKSFQQERIKAGMVVTNTQVQLKEIINRQIKIHSFYLSLMKDVEFYFKHLSNATQGESQYLDLHEKESAKTITEFIVKRALKLIGGSKGGQSLINQYKEILARRMRR